jgi:hypothetical protein
MKEETKFRFVVDQFWGCLWVGKVERRMVQIDTKICKRKRNTAFDYLMTLVYHAAIHLGEETRMEGHLGIVGERMGLLEAGHKHPQN